MTLISLLEHSLQTPIFSAKSNPGHHLFKVKSYFFVESVEGSMEAEAEVEAVDGRLKEAEAKEKLTAVASLLVSIISNHASC